LLKNRQSLEQLLIVIIDALILFGVAIDKIFRFFDVKHQSAELLLSTAYHREKYEIM